MKIIWHCLVLMVATTAWGDSPAEQPAPPTNRPSPDELRSRAQRLTPAERQARVRELRSRLGSGATNRTELEKQREEWRKLPPAEREARIREFRERHLGGRPPALGGLTPAEREAKRSEIKGRIEGQIRELESRQATGELTPAEQRRLERFRQMSRRLSQGTALGGGKRPPINERTGEPQREGKDLPPPRPPSDSPPSGASPARNP